MSSIWTDLLLLHGDALPAHLLWRPNEGIDSRRAGAALERAKAKLKTQPVAPSSQDCVKPACA
jgi:hypothetical protein